MKKILSILLASLLLVSTACNGSDSGTVTEKEDTAQNSVVNTDSTGEENEGQVDEIAKGVGFSEPVPDADKIIDDMKAGWNLGNTLDAYDGTTANETAWGNPKSTQEFFNKLAETGIGTVRIPVTYIGKIGEAPDYKIDEEWLGRVEEVAGYALNAGLYAIINIHHDGNHTTYAWLDATLEDQTEVRVKFTKIWEQLAERFQGYGGHLIFESMNEILEKGNYSTNIKPETYENINMLNQIFVDTVRTAGGENASRYLLVPGYNTNIDATAGDFGFVLPSDSAEKRLMVSAHFYDPYDLCLNESKKIYKWGQKATKGGKPNWGHEDNVDGQMQKLADAFTSKGVPVILGEYGIIDKTYVNEESNAYRRYYIEYVAKSAVEHGVLPVYWDNGYNGKNGFAIIDRNTGEPLYPELVEGLVRGATEKNYEILPPDVADWDNG